MFSVSVNNYIEQQQARTTILPSAALTSADVLIRTVGAVLDLVAEESLAEALARAALDLAARALRHLVVAQRPLGLRQGEF